MATSEEHYQAMVRLLQEIEERHVRLEIFRDDPDEPWEVHIEEDGVNESLDIDGGPICISYECGFLPVALGTAWAMFKEAMRREGRKIRLVRD